jgi:sterol desaturase/sphingolipid hydroxylase (fatty acid hydroxylase superfamily)
MPEAIRDNIGALLPAVFALTVVAVAWLEAFFPRRPLDPPRVRRWFPNLSLGLFNAAVFRLVVPLNAFTVAVVAEERGWGVLNLVPIPGWLALVLGVLAIDLFTYACHRLMHAAPILWRLHQVHHSDLEIDFTTTVRHHPVEALLNVVFVVAATIAIGLPPESVVLHRLAMDVVDFASHGNFRLPPWLDAMLRWVIVTPDMHVVHHSALRAETDSNYGALFPVWDRLFGTYVAAPAGGLADMTIGLQHGRAATDQRLRGLLLSPFTKRPFAESSVAPVGASVPK